MGPCAEEAAKDLRPEAADFGGDPSPSRVHLEKPSSKGEESEEPSWTDQGKNQLAAVLVGTDEFY
jgi:hypothetical protein